MLLSYMTKPTTKTPSKIRTYVSPSEKWVVCWRQWKWREVSTESRWGLVLHV